MRQRVIVGALIRDQADRILLLRMPTHLGVYPGQWGLVGGGVELGEDIEVAVKREVAEETNLEITDITPFTFHDTVRTKLLEDGGEEEQHLIFLIWDCCVVNPATVVLNHEWEEYVWVLPDALSTYDLNQATLTTFRRKGWL